jgi:ParB-like chromosome segregation protein Spo0J
MGDLQVLANSIANIGLLQPIGINQDNRLIFGGRRLAATKLLGRDEIDVWVLDVPSILVAEIDENEIRKEFTASERVALAAALESEEKRLAKERMLAGKAAEPCGQLATGFDTGKSRDFIANKVGFGSAGSYRRAKRAVENSIPEVVEAMDREDITLYRADLIAGLPKEQQLAALNGEIALPKQVRGKKIEEDSPKKEPQAGYKAFIDPEYEESITKLSTKVMGFLLKMEPTMRRDPVAVERLRMISDECNRLIKIIESRKSK